MDKYTEYSNLVAKADKSKWDGGLTPSEYTRLNELHAWVLTTKGAEFLK